MSQRYPGGFITKTPTAPTSSAAPGIWTVDQAMQNQKAGNWPSPPSPYIEDWFSTYLYTGNSSTQTITNGIDLAGKGGLLWIKNRSNSQIHRLFDTARGNNVSISSDSDQGNSSGFAANGFAFNANGFSLGSFASYNQSPDNYVSWTFGKRQKFFDIATWTGDGTSSKTISHNLGATPGCIIVKNLTTAQDWLVYHTSLGNTKALFLDLTTAAATSTGYWNDTSPTSTNFTVGSSSRVNESGSSFVAYLFAHNAGGFGLTGSDNVISCGSFTTDGSGNVGSVNLGYEPQWILTKSTGSQNWYVWDTMRGDSLTAQTYLSPNLATADNTSSGTAYIYPTATGFSGSGNWFGLNATVIYIAIRRGPMKVPTVGTSVYTSASRTGTAGVMPRWVAGFPVDWALRKSDVTTGGGDWQAGDRLRGAVQVKPNLTEAETSASPLYIFDGMTGYSTLGAAGSDSGDRSWMFRRAPGFFDEVCYTGTGVAGLSVTHNLTVPPEMIIVKRRDSTGDWPVLMRNVDRLGSAGSSYRVNSTASWDPAGVYFSDSSGTFVPATDATSSVFRVANPSAVNASGGTYVAYLFATCAGVSKVGSYTGTGTTLPVNCGFTSGARFVLIKRADSTGDWYVYDSARGIVSGNDPYLLLNSTAAEVTGTDYVDTYNAGFELSSTAPAALNANGGTYIFLAIA
jgi:hypothetical protein